MDPRKFRQLEEQGMNAIEDGDPVALTNSVNRLHDLHEKALKKQLGITTDEDRKRWERKARERNDHHRA